MFEWLSSLPIWAQVAVGVVLGGIILAMIYLVITTDPQDWGCLFSLFALAAIIVVAASFFIWGLPAFRWDVWLPKAKVLVAALAGFGAIAGCVMFVAAVFNRPVVAVGKNEALTKTPNLDVFPESGPAQPFICSFRDRSGWFRAAMGESAEIISTTPQKALLEYVRGLEGKPYPKEAHYLFAESEEGRVVHKFSIRAFEEYAEVKRTDTDSV